MNQRILFASLKHFVLGKEKSLRIYDVFNSIISKEDFIPFFFAKIDGQTIHPPRDVYRLVRSFYPKATTRFQFHQHFTSEDPNSAKNTVKPSVFFALLGYVSVKAVHKMLVKLTQGLNFTSI